MADDEDGDGKPDLLAAWMVVACIVGSFVIFVSVVMLRSCA